MSYGHDFTLVLEVAGRVGLQDARIEARQRWHVLIGKTPCKKKVTLPLLTGGRISYTGGGLGRAWAYRVRMALAGEQVA